jgi:hypothetical protein
MTEGARELAVHASPIGEMKNAYKVLDKKPDGNRVLERDIKTIADR